MFAFRLAARLGKTVRQLLADIDSQELSEWEAYDRLEPIDTARRLELAAAKTTQMLGNIHREKNADPFKASAFMQDWGAEWREQPTASDGAAALEQKIDNAMSAIRGLQPQCPP